MEFAPVWSRLHRPQRGRVGGGVHLCAPQVPEVLARLDIVAMCAWRARKRPDAARTLLLGACARPAAVGLAAASAFAGVAALGVAAAAAKPIDFVAVGERLRADAAGAGALEALIVPRRRPSSPLAVAPRPFLPLRASRSPRTARLHQQNAKRLRDLLDLVCFNMLLTVSAPG